MGWAIHECLPIGIAFQCHAACTVSAFAPQNTQWLNNHWLPCAIYQGLHVQQSTTSCCTFVTLHTPKPHSRYRCKRSAVNKGNQYCMRQELHLHCLYKSMHRILNFKQTMLHNPEAQICWQTNVDAFALPAGISRLRRLLTEVTLRVRHTAAFARLESKARGGLIVRVLHVCMWKRK